MAALLEAENLTAGYGQTAVLHGLDFAVEERGVTALLGANGAGKTTTLRAVCGMVRTGGQVRLAGERLNGLATEEIAAQRDLVFDYFPRPAERADQPAGTLSGGEQQMLAIAQAMMSQPRRLLIGEASLGLSPALAKTVFQVVSRINDSGTTVILVEQNIGVLPYADRALIMEKGTLIYEGVGDEIRSADLRETYLGGGE